jgi:hypothetical protein
VLRNVRVFYGSTKIHRRKLLKIGHICCTEPELTESLYILCIYTHVITCKM